MLLIFLVGLLLVEDPPDDIVQQSKYQAQYYINHIEDGTNVEANAWALTTLAAGNANIRSYIEGEVQANSYNKVLQLFDNIESNYTDQLKRVVFKTGSSNLLVDLLLNTKNKEEKEKLYQQFLSRFTPPQINGVNYRVLFRSIIEGGPINNKELSGNSFRLPHFFLLYRDYKLLPQKYLEKITKSWATQNQPHKKLSSSLFHASHLRALYLRYKYGQTLPLYNSLIDEKILPNSNLKLRIHRYLDYSMYRLGYYDRSLKVVRNISLPLANYLEMENEKISLKQLQGVYLYSIGKIKEAQKIYYEVLALTQDKNINISRSSLYNNLALTHYKLGHYEKYLNLQFQALEKAKELDNYTHQLNVYKNLYIYYRQSNDLDNALQYLDKAQKLALKKGKVEELGKIYTLHGQFYRMLKQQYSLAHEYYSKAKEILDPKNNAKYYTDLLKEQAFAFEQQERFEKALNKQNEIIHLFPDRNNPNYIFAIVNKAAIYSKKGNTKKTKELTQNFKSLSLYKLPFPQLIKAKTVEADFAKQVGNPQRAIDILEAALNQIVARAQNSTDLKSGFWHVEDEYLDAFELTVSTYIENGQPGKAIEKLDQLKTINDASYYQNPLVKSSLLSESELTQYKNLTRQLDATRKKLLTAAKDQQLDIKQNITRLKLKKRKLDRKLTKGIDSNPISVREVQNTLSARELVMHITELKNQYYVAQITRSNVTIKTIPLDNGLRNLLSGSAQQVATHKTDLDSLYKISRILELEKIPNRIEKVTLIPDSYFYQLPIDILPLERPDKSYSYGEVKYVIEDFRTQYLTSLGNLRPKPKINKNSLNYIGYGISNFSGYNQKSLVPLPFAQTEVTSIADRLTHLSDVQTYINEESTKPTFTQTAPKASILHLATHSEVSERDPMFSTVYLSKTKDTADSTFNDRVFAYELFELDLSNEMIMLNSCESGSGSYIQGTGVMGISRALQYAGARSLVLNLWSVNDMLASDFAIHFYDQLNQGKSKAEALRNTKRYFLRTKNASPHFWGPYMLIGETDPIVEPHQDKNLAMAGAFIFYFLLMVGLSYLTQKNILFRNRKGNTATAYQLTLEGK